MKQHNSDPDAKVELRRVVIDRMGGIDACKVYESHAGPGLMRDSIWSGAPHIYGSDIDPYSIAETIGDSLQIMRRIDLSAFNVFDLDPFGDYREFLWVASKARKIDERVAIICTDGISGGFAGMHPTMSRHGASHQVLAALGMRGTDKVSAVIGTRGAEWQFSRLVASWFPDCSVVKFHAMSKTGKMHYHAAILTPGEV